jgi:hypothetical protein
MSDVKQLAHPGMLIVSKNRKCVQLFLCVPTERNITKQNSNHIKHDSLRIAITQSKFAVDFTSPVIFFDEEILR